MSCFLDRVTGSGSMIGYPRVQSLSRMGKPIDAALPGPPPNEPDDSLLGASCQRTKASRTCSIALVARSFSRYVWWKGNAAGLGPKRGEKVGGECPEDDKWAVRRVKREIILIMIEGCDFCKCAMRTSK